MKKLFIIGAVALLSLQAFAATDDTQLISCLVNKSNSLDIYLKSSEGSIQQVELYTRDFLGRNKTHVVTLVKPQLSEIQYGDVTMVQQNFGKSGYVFLRFERKSQTEYNGLIDVYYFQSHSFRTGGNLVSMPCFSYEQ